MDDHPLPPSATPDEVVTGRAGFELLDDPILNKGTAFPDPERDAFHLHGLLPPYVSTLEGQVSRRLQVLREVAIEIAKAVAATAIEEGHSDAATREIEDLVGAKVWTPRYVPYRCARQ